MTAIANRYDFVLLFDVANGNPQYIEICAGLIDNPVSADHQSSFW